MVVTLGLYYIGLIILGLNCLMFAARVVQEKKLRAHEDAIRRLILRAKLRGKRRR